MEFTKSNTMRQFVKSKFGSSTQTLLTLQLDTLVGNLTSLLLTLHHVERVTCCWCTIESKDDGRLCRTGLLNTLITLVEHSLYFTPGSTCDNHVANLQGTIRYQYSRNIATTFVKRALDDTSSSLSVRISLQVKHLCFKQHLFKQFINTDTLLGAYLLALVLTAPLLNKQIHVCQILTNLIRISTWFIYLIDSEHHWYVSSLSMSDSLLGGRHH